jgi:hypothetical protein
MPSPRLTQALADHATIVGDLYDLVEADRDTLRAQGQEMAAQLSRARDTETSLRAEIERLKQQPVPSAPPPVGPVIPWTPATVLTEGGVYSLPDGAAVNIKVRVSCTFVGGKVWPIDSRPAFDHDAGRLTIVGTTFDHPDPPPDAGNPQKYGMGACVATSSHDGGAAVDCVFGKVDQPVKCTGGSKGFAIVHGSGSKHVTSAFLGCWGDVRDVAVIGVRAEDSVTENLIRFSPQNGVAPAGAVVAFSTLANPGNKTPLNPRHVDWFVALRNRLTASDDHAAVGIGRTNPAGTDGPGATNIYILDNDIAGGTVKVYGGSNRVTIEGNRVAWPTKPVNVFISANAKGGVLKELRIANNTGKSPVAQKHMVDFDGDVKPPELVEKGNGWAVPIP